MKFMPKMLGIMAVVLLISGFQIIKTTLHITVRDELGNTVQDASVQLFETEEDYLKEENVVAQDSTDKRGIVRFKDLKPISYYVIIRHGDKDNSGGGERTAELEERRINKVTIVIQ